MIISCEKLPKDIIQKIRNLNGITDLVYSGSIFLTTESSTGNKKCYRPRSFDKTDKLLSELTFTGFDELSSESALLLPKIVNEIEYFRSSLPEAQRDKPLDLNINGHTGYWQISNFFDDLHGGNSKALKAISNLREKGYLPETFVKEVSTFLDLTKNMKGDDLSPENYQAILNIQSKYFEALSKLRAETICGKLMAVVQDKTKTNCKSAGKGTAHANVPYDKYVLMNDKEQTETNERLRRINATITASEQRTIEEKTVKSEQKFSQVYYSVGSSETQDSPETDARMISNKNINDAIKSRFKDGRFNHCLQDESATSSIIEKFEIKSNEASVLFEEFNSESKSELGKGNHNDKNYSVDSNFFPPPYTEATNISLYNGIATITINGAKTNISIEEFNKLENHTKKKIPDFDAQLLAARLIVKKKSEKLDVDESALPSSAKELSNDANKVALATMFETQGFCGDLLKEYLSDMGEIKNGKLPSDLDKKEEFLTNSSNELESLHEIAPQ